MDSPCINVCVIDRETGLCEGCFRTIDEIGRWASMSRAERLDVMAELEQRRPATRKDA